jgi:beta-lactamase superfamily II metal-dependent hydrolase
VRDFAITMLGVGHGDSFLLRLPESADHPEFVCLVDGGQSRDRLQKGLDRNGVKRIDLLVVTHVDADHLGGIAGIEKDREVANYWGPCLPAFERHSWLFAGRVLEAVNRARAIENALAASGAQVIYPLEGFRSSPRAGGSLFIEVLSPAARLIQTLLTANDISWLFSQTPMPMGWLLEPEATPVEETLAGRVLRQQAMNFAFRPAEMPDLPESQRSDDMETLRSADPEFFGDSVLNNTSIVTWVQAGAGPARRSMLLTGDLENWTYLLAQHPRGLRADILKAPHHGGQLFLERGHANEEVLSTVRPRAVLVSANGRHHLPHYDLRATAARWGATVFCTAQRQVEAVQGGTAVNNCCHDSFGCTESRDVTVSFEAGNVLGNVAACHSGYGVEPGPVIQLAQHIVAPSKLVSRLVEQELEINLKWVQGQLLALHQERVQKSGAASKGSEAVSTEVLKTRARAEENHMLAANLQEVLKRGSSEGRFWVSEGGYRESEAYILPGDNEKKALIEALRKKEALIFTNRTQLKSMDRASVLNSLAREDLAELCEAAVSFPVVTFEVGFWPGVMRELSRGWHCFVHRIHSLALTRIGDARQFSRRLYELGYAADLWREGHPWKRREAEEILVSQPKNRSTYTEWPGYWLKEPEFREKEWPEAAHRAADELAEHLTKLW